MNKTAKKSLTGLICFMVSVFWFFFLLVFMFGFYNGPKHGHAPLIFLGLTLGGVGVLCVLRCFDCVALRPFLGIVSWFCFSVLFLCWCIIFIGYAS